MMIYSVIEEFSNELLFFLSSKSKNTKSMLVKKHSDHLEQYGDFSFPNTLKSWHLYIDSSSKNSDITLLQYIKKQANDIIQESKSWSLEVAKVKEDKTRVYLFLDRFKSVQIGLREALHANNEIQDKMCRNKGKVHYDNSDMKSDCLTSLRVKCVMKTIENIYSIYSKDCENMPPIIISSKSSTRSETGHVILCGAVLNSKNGSKEMDIKAEYYIRLRQNEMTLIAQHKYGVRVSTDSKWKEFIQHLGESAAIFELLQTKPSSAVKINFDCSSAGSSKGAAFILYNCARLESIIKTFNDKVNEGVYPPLPTFEETDFSLLTQEEEWCLIFNYIMGFPTLLNNSVEISERICEFRPHQICGFLCAMVRVFSQYYRRVRILTEPRKHLLPVLFARLYLLKILNDTLKTCLKILNIKSVSQMYFQFLLPVLLIVKPLLGIWIICEAL